MGWVPLEKGKSEVYRQREARAARLASEIESSSQYRRRVSLENDEGRSEEDKYSAVVRDREERASPGFSSATREGKYIPLPQRAREMGLNPSTMRGGASPRQPAPTSSPKSPSDRSSPLSVRTAYSPHQLQGSPPAAASPPCSNHTLSHPQTDASRPSVNGVPSRTSPKSQRFQNNRNLRAASSQSSPAIARTVKADVPPQELPVTGAAYLDSSSSSVPLANSKPSGPTPLFPVDVNEILNSAAKERSEALSPQEGKNSKVPSVQQRSQLEELRKFGKEFRLQPSSTPSASPSSPTEAPQAADPKPAPVQGLQQTTELSAPPTTAAAAAAPPAGPEGPMPGGPQPAVAPGSECPRPEGESTAVAAVHVKNSTLNPNAKEFLPIKGPPPLQKPAPTPTPPRQAPPSPSVVLPPLPGQPGAGAIYSSPPTPYLSYVSPFPLQGQSVQAPQMYQYAMTAVSQGKYPRAKGPMVGPRSDPHVSQASSMIQTAASAAGPPLVATPYPQSYLHYGQLLQATPPHYHAQPMYSVLQGGARMLTAGAPPQAMGPTGHQYPGQAEGPQGPQQAIYAPQSFSHHSGAMHRPQPSSTPTGTQPPLQHTAPSPGHAQSGQGGPQPQSIYHSGALSGPSNLPPPHSSQQASYPMQAYSLSPHQALQHGFPQISQLTQAHVAAGMSGPHHPAGHGPPVMLHYAPQQQAPGSNPQQGAHQHYYITPSQAVQVQAHAPQPLTFHPTGN